MSVTEPNRRHAFGDNSVTPNTPKKSQLPKQSHNLKLKPLNKNTANTLRKLDPTRETPSVPGVRDEINLDSKEITLPLHKPKQLMPISRVSNAKVNEVLKNSQISEITTQPTSKTRMKYYSNLGKIKYSKDEYSQGVYVDSYESGYSKQEATETRGSYDTSKCLDSALSHLLTFIVGDLNMRSLDLQRKVDELRNIKETSRQRQSAVRIKKQSLRLAGTIAVSNSLLNVIIVN